MQRDGEEGVGRDLKANLKFTDDDQEEDAENSLKLLGGKDMESETSSNSMDRSRAWDPERTS